MECNTDNALINSINSCPGNLSLNPPADIKVYTNMNEIFIDYEKLANEAASIILYNHSAYSKAIEMAF